jgi:phytoene desaturase
MKKRVAIIGSGIGGLSASIYLARDGFDVTIFEKNSFLGGKSGEIVANRFRFDTGPTLVTMPFVLEELFLFTGKNLSDHISLKKKEIVCKYFYPDGSVFNEYSNKEKLIDEFENFTGEKKDNLIKFLNYSKRIYDLTAELFLFNPFLDLKNFLNPKGFKTLLNFHQIDPFRTIHKANSSFFNSSKIIQLFDRYATYNGSNPYKAPATLNIIPFVEIEFGGYHSQGGIYRIVEKLAELAKEVGVKIFASSEVEKILINKTNVEGLKVNGLEAPFDIVISNADLYYTYCNLIGKTNSREPERYIKQELSTSAIIFYFGVKGVSNNLEMDNILFSEKYESEFNQLFVEKLIPADPTVHIHISAKENKTDAPEDFENWYVMINAPSVENLKFEISEVKKNILTKIKKMTGIDLENKIVFEAYQTPETLEKRTSGLFGSLYGPSSNSRYSAFLRQKNKSSVYNGLYFCGGTVHPGGGIPLVILSGKITADLIRRYEK